jgi:hypothetical protein
MEHAVSEEPKPPAVAALVEAARALRTMLEPARAELDVIPMDPCVSQTRNVLRHVTAYVENIAHRMEVAACARQVEPAPDLIRIRHLSAIEMRLEGALEDLEAAKDIDEDALRVLDSTDGLTRAYDTIKRVQMAVRLALSKDNATPYG